MIFQIYDTWLNNPLLIFSTFSALFIANLLIQKRAKGIQPVSGQHVIDESDRSNEYRMIRWILEFTILVCCSVLIGLASPQLSIIPKFAELTIGIIFFRYTLSFKVVLEQFFSLQDTLDFPDDIKGQIIFSTSFIYHSARVSFFVFGILWFILYLLIGRLFFLGGVVGSFLYMSLLPSK